MNRKNILRITYIIVVLILVYVCINYKKNDVNKESTVYDFAMGTSISATVYSKDSKDASNIIDVIKNMDKDVISFRESGSEIASLNSVLHDSDIVEFNASNDLYDAVKRSYQICVDSNGALDISLRPLLSLWNIEDVDEGTFAVPKKAEIEKALSETGYENIYMEDDGRKIRTSVTIDLGSTGKGYVLDKVKNYLDEKKVHGAIVSAGGSVLAYGEKMDGSSWKIGIRNPKGAVNDMIGYLEFNDIDYVFVSTSGDYEKYVEKDGVRYHHILDRATGYPADSGLSSVTIVSKNGLESDGLSTACFILGEEKSIELLKKYSAEAVFIDKDGNVSLTDGLKDYYKWN